MKLISKKLTLLFFILNPHLILSQETGAGEKMKKDNSDYKALFSLSMGPSVPLANFGNKDLNDQSAGLAKTGLNYQAKVSYTISSNFGITAKAFYFYNPQDANEWLSNFLQGASPNQYFKITTNPWEFKGFAAGIFSTIEVEDSYADFRLLIGFTNIKFPNVLIEEQEGLKNTTYFLEAKSKNAPVFEIGLGLRIPMAKQLDGLIDFDFLNSEVQFDVYDIENGIKYTQTTRVSVTNISLGAALKF